jgi:hypothetical protein
MSKPLSRRLRDFFTGFPNIYSASPDSGAPRDYVRAGFSHLNEVFTPQSPRTESGPMIPPIVTHSSCLPISPDSVDRYLILFSIFCPAAPSPESGALTGKRSVPQAASCQSSPLTSIACMHRNR